MMTELFEEDLLDEDLIETDEDIDVDVNESGLLDARRRLENMLEERRLREELDDFMDY